jgi:hypothetical protein
VVYLQQLQDFNAEAARLAPLSSNRRISVVQQIGNDNTVISRTTSETADLGYLQLGNANTIESFSSIQRYSEGIIQQGNGNEVFNESFGPVENASFNLIQFGNNLTYQKIGTNSQTDNISLIQTAATPVLIIRSN